MTTNSIDTDMSGTLLTTEWGNPPQSQPAGVDNYQGYGATGQGIEKVYKYLYDPTDNSAPLDESEGGLALQEQEWVGEVEYLQEADPEFIEGGDITGDVVFENPLDTLSAADTSTQESSAGENVVDYDYEEDPAVGQVAFGVTEGAEEAETASETPQEGSEGTEADEAPVVAPEDSEASTDDTETQE